jgi:hypothetical protein
MAAVSWVVSDELWGWSRRCYRGILCSPSESDFIAKP